MDGSQRMYAVHGVYTGLSGAGEDPTATFEGEDGTDVGRAEGDTQRE